MNRVRNIIGDKKGKVLDIGCLKCHLKDLLGECYDYTGLDFTKFNNNTNIIVRDLNRKPSPPFPSNSFDIVVCTEVLEHLFHINDVAGEINRVLKPNGIAIIIFPNEINLLQRLKILFGINPIKFHEYEHHWFFDVKIARGFVKRKFRVVKEHFFPAAFWPSLLTVYMFFKVTKSRGRTPTLKK